MSVKHISGDTKVNADPIRQMSKRNEHNMLSLMRIKEYALLTIRYANEGMLDNKQIREILCSKDLEESEKARKILALFEEREIDRELDQNPQCNSNCEFEANLLRGLKQIRELAVGINSGNYAKKELVNESF
jgi:hypothetical protein